MPQLRPRYAVAFTTERAATDALNTAVAASDDVVIVWLKMTLKPSTSFKATMAPLRIGRWQIRGVLHSKLGKTATELPANVSDHMSA